jgi:hypothetical protein
LSNSLKPVVDIGFERVRNGTRCNRFIKSNGDLAEFIRWKGLGRSRDLPVFCLYKVLNDEAFTGRVLASKGCLSSWSEFVVDGEGQISGLVSLSRDFMVGDVLTVVTLLLKGERVVKNELVVLSTRGLGAWEIGGLECSRELVINRENWPELNVNTLMRFPGRVLGVVMAAIVTGHGGRSTAFFSVPFGNFF